MNIEQTTKAWERVSLPKAAMQTLPVPGVGDILSPPSVVDLYIFLLLQAAVLLSHSREVSESRHSLGHHKEVNL